MTKHARKSRRFQPVERPPAATVQIPLPVLGASPALNVRISSCASARASRSWTR